MTSDTTYWLSNPSDFTKVDNLTVQKERGYTFRVMTPRETVLITSSLSERVRDPIEKCRCRRFVQFLGMRISDYLFTWNWPRRFRSQLHLGRFTQWQHGMLALWTPWFEKDYIRNYTSGEVWQGKPFGRDVLLFWRPRSRSRASIPGQIRPHHCIPKFYIPSHH